MDDRYRHLDRTFNGEDLLDQTAETLLIPGMTHEQAGACRVVATNEHGAATSRPINVTVGAIFSKLFNTGTGVDPNGVLGLLPGLTEDPHYRLVDGNDPFLRYESDGILVDDF